MMNEIFKKLSAPFPAADIEWRAGPTNKDKTKALALAYITSRAVMDRLDEVCSPENWQDEYKPAPSGGVLCGLSVQVNNKWITKWDGAENTDFEGVKGGLSAAFKRAGSKWGIGRYLYKLDGSWVPCEQRGKSVILKETPNLPAWALPEGNGKKDKPKETEQPEPTAEYWAEIEKARAEANKPKEVKEKKKPPPPAQADPRPYSPALVRNKIQSRLNKHNKFEPSKAQQNLLRYGLELCFPGDPEAEDKRHAVLNYLSGYTSTKDVDGQYFKVIVEDFLKMKQLDDGSSEYKIDPMAAMEVKEIYGAALKEQGPGQMELE